jgi:glyoxylate/hydroxypyruvate reductase
MKIYVVVNANEKERNYLIKHTPKQHVVVFQNQLAEDDRLQEFRAANIVVGNAPKAWFEPMPTSLKWFQLESAGFDKYTGMQLDIPVTNMGDFYAIPCAETMMAGVLALYRQVHQLTLLQQEKYWIGDDIRMASEDLIGLRILSGQKVVVLGAGEIGLKLRKMLEGFDCEVALYARTNENANIRSINALKEVLRTTDLVISTLPGTAINLFDASCIDAMKKGSVFANVGRGNTVDEQALILALQNNHLSGAVLDVNAIEPLPIDNPLWSMPNVLILQHTGGGQQDENIGKFNLFLNNLMKFEQDVVLDNVVQIGRGY